MLEYENKLKADPVVKELTTSLKDIHALWLTGGAVMDILNNKLPKDYDITTGYSREYLRGNLPKDFKFLYSSRTADTYLFRSRFIVQFLVRQPLDFKFTIEASKYRFNRSSLEYFCTTSFEGKILIPQDSAFVTNEITRSDYLGRIKHLEGKGFSIPDITKNSYLDWCKQSWWQKLFTKKRKES